MKTILIAETVSLNPHLETAGELALRSINDGHKVIFLWLAYGLPWSDWSLSFIYKALGCSLKKREKKFMEILSYYGVEVIRDFQDDISWNELTDNWSNNFIGDLVDLKKYSFDNLNLGMGAASSLISFTGDSKFDPQKNIKLTRKCLKSSLLIYLRTKKALSLFKPNLVLTFNGRFALSKPIVLATQNMGISILRHERGHDYSSYELYEDAIHNFDFIYSRICSSWKSANKMMRKKIAHEFYIRKRNGDGIGWFSFVENQKKDYIPQKNKKRRLVYFSSSDDEFAAVTDSYKPGPWEDQLSAISDLIKASKKYNDIEVIIRIHPHLIKKSKLELIRWKKFIKLGIKIIEPSAKIDSYALIDSADIVATYGSTIGIEAAYWGKPSLLLGPSSYSESGAVIKANNLLEIQKFLNPTFNLRIPNQDKCLPYGYYYLSYGEKFLYYKPKNLFSGEFVGIDLNWSSFFVNFLRNIHYSLKNLKKLF